MSGLVAHCSKIGKHVLINKSQHVKSLLDAADISEADSKTQNHYACCFYLHEDTISLLILSISQDIITGL